MFKVQHTPERNSTKERFNIILDKLHATIARHKAAFPELATIEEFLDLYLTTPVAGTDKAYYERLDGLCSHLLEKGVKSYVIRHLHHNICMDVEALKNKSFTFIEEEYYITMPK